MATNNLENKLKEIRKEMEKYGIIKGFVPYIKNGAILSYAFIAKKYGKEFVVKDGKENQPYDGIE